MKMNTIKAAPAASAIALKNEKSAKAKRILIGTDVHLRGYQAARKVDNGVIGVVENFRSEEALLLHVEKQCERAEQVVVVYEAGPLGYTLYRKLTARGALCYVCAPDSSEQKRKRRKNNKIDARNLTSKLFNYLNGGSRSVTISPCADRGPGCGLAAYFRKRGRDDYGRGEKVSDPKMKGIGD
jgi:hypothetical protein